MYTYVHIYCNSEHLIIRQYAGTTVYTRIYGEHLIIQQPTSISMYAHMYTYIQ